MGGVAPAGAGPPLPFRTRSGGRTPGSRPPVTAAGGRHEPGWDAVSSSVTGDPVFQVTSREPEFLTGLHWEGLLRPYCLHRAPGETCYPLLLGWAWSRHPRGLDTKPQAASPPGSAGRTPVMGSCCRGLGWERAGAEGGPGQLPQRTRGSRAARKPRARPLRRAHRSARRRRQTSGAALPAVSVSAAVTAPLGPQHLHGWLI